MKKKYFILAITFLCLLVSGNSFGQYVNSDYDFDDPFGDDGGDDDDDDGDDNTYEVCTNVNSALIQSFDCVDIYLTVEETYYCNTGVHINQQHFEDHVYKECGTVDSGDCHDPSSNAFPCTDPPTDPEDPSTDPEDPPTDPEDPPTDPEDPPIYPSISLSITDSNNWNRSVGGGQTLVMVNSGNDREANMTVSVANCTISNGYPVWSGNGVTANGTTANYSGFSGTSSISVNSNCGSAGGNIQIVPEGKISLSSEIDIIKTKINDVSDTFRSFVEAKGNTVELGGKSCTLTGTIERKNVDMYADGTKYGNATSLDLVGTYSMTMPKVKIPIYSAGIANVFATLNLGSATASLNVKGSLDDSTAAKIDIEGGFELGFTAASGTISATLGSAEHLCVEASGGVSVAYFKVGAKVQGNSNATGLLLAPELKVGNVKATYSLSAKVDIGTISERCEIIAGEYKIWEPEEIPFSPIILYQKQ